MKKIEAINFLRGFAIFTIVLMHCVQGYLDGALHKAALLGGAGVHVFILCSGFGLYLSYLNKPLGYKDFLKRRFGKVYFPYVIVIALYALWGVAVAGGVNWEVVASHVFLYKMFDSELDISLCYPFWFISTDSLPSDSQTNTYLKKKGGVFAYALDKSSVGYDSRMFRI